MPPLNTAEPAEFSESGSSSHEDSDGESTDAENITIYASRPSLRNARDLALMAEERWLIEMLKSIRQQRNALKVEALYYQGLKAELYAQHAMEFGETAPSPPVPPDNDIDLPIPEPTYPELSPELEECFAPNGPLTSERADILKRLKRMGDKQKATPSNLEDFTIHEGQCNLEELPELTVDRPEKKTETWDIEDPEYESEEEEEWSRVNIDMSMLVGDNEADI